MARENATLRQEFLRRRLATEEQLEEIGWVSHEDLDLWEAAGVLELGVAGLQELWTRPLSLEELDWLERLHPRGRGGKWIEKLGDIKLPGEGLRQRRYQTSRLQRIRREPAQRAPGEIAVLKGKRGPIRGRRYQVFQTPEGLGPEARQAGGTIPERMTTAQFHEEATSSRAIHQAGADRLERMAGEERRKGRAAAARGDHRTAAQHHKRAQSYTEAQRDKTQTRVHGEAELYERRTKKLERRVRRQTRAAGERVTPAAGAERGPHDLSAAEVHFNDAGHLSQKTLLAYAEEATTRPTTAEMYRDKDGNYHPSRAALHKDIIDKMLRQHEYGPDGKDRGLSVSAPPLQAPDGPPSVIFTGGGYAAGKGGVRRQLAATGQIDRNWLVLDPDLIKAEIPEFQATAADDPEANLRVYSEAWDIAQEVMKEAQERHLNVLVDGITNTNSDEVAARVKSFTDAGYVNPRIKYVSAPTDETIARAKRRATKLNAPLDDRRMIPESVMRSVHRDVSATIPGVMAKSGEMGADVEVYDTNQGLDPVSGRPNAPRLVAHAGPDGSFSNPEEPRPPSEVEQVGEYPISSRQAYANILAKAEEQVPGVPDIRVEGEGAWSRGERDVSIHPRVERGVGANMEAAFRRAESPQNDDALQPVGGTEDPEELLRLAASRGLQPYRALLDLGRGVIDALGGQHHDVSAGDDFLESAHTIETNMGQRHLLIAPPKGARRAYAKVAAEGRPNDFRHLRDALRATISVPTAQELPGAIDETIRQAKARGWTVENIKNRMVDRNGNSNRFKGNGYGDVSLILRGPPETGKDGHPPGMLAELQVNTNTVWWTKEVGPGHAYYELEREIKDAADAEGRETTPEEKELIKEIQAAAKPLYDRAWGASQNGGIPDGVDPRPIIMGDALQRAAAAAKLQDLTRQQRALMAAIHPTVAAAA